MIRSLLVLVVATLAACACPPDVQRFGADSCRGRLTGKYVELRWRAGREAHTFTTSEGELELDVRRVRNLLALKQVEVEIWFTSSLPDELRFDLADVTLEWDGREVPATRCSARTPAVRPGRAVRLTFTFDADTGGRAGVHDLAIERFHGTDDGPVPSPGRVAVPVKIPGRVGPQDDWDDDASYAPAKQPDPAPRSGGDDDWRDDR